MKKKICIQGAVVALMTALMTVPALAAPTGDVSGVIEQTWQSAATQIKTVVNSVVFPALDMILVVCIDGWHDILRAYARQYGITKLVVVVQ